MLIAHFVSILNKPHLQAKPETIRPTITKHMDSQMGRMKVTLPVSQNSQNFLSATVIQKDKMVKFQEENEKIKEFTLNIIFKKFNDK